MDIKETPKAVASKVPVEPGSKYIETSSLFEMSLMNSNVRTPEPIWGRGAKFCFQDVSKKA
jgi:hypothetical protein